MRSEADTGYAATFRARAREYALACRRYPEARFRERDLLVKLLEVSAGDVVLDHPAGSGYLAEGVEEAASALSVVCAEPVAAFAENIPSHFHRLRFGFDDFALRSGSVDRVGSLAGLHHLDAPRSFFAEAHRVLRPGGLLVVGEVLDDTPVARFLEGPVHRWSETGHRGRYFAPGELVTHLTEAGFSDCDETVQRFTWDFPDWGALLFFAKNLFGLSRASLPVVRRELSAAFEIGEDAAGVHLPWMLVYGRGRKA